MANQTVNFTINLDGNAYTGIAQIDAALGNVLVVFYKSYFCNLKTKTGVADFFKERCSLFDRRI